ncbi:MAG: FeoB-associated Cys-rich membrane protein [Lachnospiraceae bacterium]|nr:FeoB-associated Cys-rich membrane protein [Lachnospiraceae bacterium]
MADLILVIVLLMIVGAAVIYIVKEKKKGVKCIGCPAAGACAHAHKCNGGGCSGHEDGDCQCHQE